MSDFTGRMSRLLLQWLRCGASAHIQPCLSKLSLAVTVPNTPCLLLTATSLAFPAAHPRSSPAVTGLLTLHTVPTRETFAIVKTLQARGH